MSFDLCYEYNFAGEFTPAKLDIDWEIEADWPEMMRQNGWVLDRKYGDNCQFEISVFRRIRPEEDKGQRLVDLSDQEGTIWYTLVSRTGWPLFFRKEILPFIHSPEGEWVTEQLKEIAQQIRNTRR